MKHKLFINIVALFSILIYATSICAQTASFTYQGKLNDGVTAANGNYQFEFRLYDAASGGNQIGNTISNLPATVTNGIFAVNLDFGASSFDGAARFLEIGVRLNGSGQPYTTLNPRQAVTSTPYAVKSLNAQNAVNATTADNSTNLGGIAANQYVQTNDSRMSNARDPLAGSANYIQNATNPQASSNFNISGEGKADKFTAATQFNIGANRVLSNPGTDNLFAGVNAGTSNAAGSNNSFFGANAGKTNTTGGGNSFFGRNAGFGNTIGSNNAFFGSAAGQSNADGVSNAFFGGGAGLLNTSGSFNVFVGRNSGSLSSTGGNNTFVGSASGNAITNGTDNVFIGANAGSTGNVTNSIAIGSNVKVTSSYTAQIGTADTNVKIPGDLEVGQSFNAATATIANNFTVNGSASIGGSLNVTGSVGAGSLSVQTGNMNQGNITQLLTTGAVMNGLTFIQKLKISILSPTGGSTDDLCLAEDDNTVRRCFLFFSEMDNVQDFSGGLNVIKNLRPVTFGEGANNSQNVGLMFADASAANSLFAKRDGNAITGIRQREIVTALVSATQEQQAQIEKQNEQIRQQQAQIEALKALICAGGEKAAICQK